MGEVAEGQALAQSLRSRENDDLSDEMEDSTVNDRRDSVLVIGNTLSELLRGVRSGRIKSSHISAHQV